MVQLLEKMLEANGSDLFIAAGMPPRINVEGKLHDLSPEPLSPEDTQQMVSQILTKNQWTLFLRKRELNIAYPFSKTGRFRVNVYFQQGTVASVIRRVQLQIPTFEQLHLPLLLRDLALSPRGLVLVTGAAGAGKSTTMAAMLDYRASNMEGHIVTVEDPIEYVFQHKKSVVTQREIGTDTLSLKEALKNTLRQAPTVIYIGELRDAETVEFALHCAETGHLVLSTLHSTNGPQTIERILNFFLRDYHHQILMQLSYQLRAVISQRLIITESGHQIPVLEILLNTPFVRELVYRGELGQLKKAMEMGQQEGMQTFDLHLKELVEKGIISEERALTYADSPNDLRLKLRGFV